MDNDTTYFIITVRYKHNFFVKMATGGSTGLGFIFFNGGAAFHGSGFSSKRLFIKKLQQQVPNKPTATASRGLYHKTFYGLNRKACISHPFRKTTDRDV
jgi:hypothetical protein